MHSPALSSTNNLPLDPVWSHMSDAGPLGVTLPLCRTFLDNPSLHLKVELCGTGARTASNIAANFPVM